jgi:hypothetical protein
MPTSVNFRKGQYFGLYLVTEESPETLTLVACLNNKSFKITNKVIDGTSDCGPAFLAGFPNSTANCKGFLSFGDGTVVSGQELFDLANSGASAVWVIRPVANPNTPPNTGDVEWYFTAFLANYQNDFNTDQMADFSVDFQIQGTITQQLF